MKDYKDFLVSYRFDGSSWSAKILAHDFDEATQRLRAMGMNGQVDGELVATIPANTFTEFPISILLPIIVAVRNFFWRIFRGWRQ